jgi:rubrerythrin
MLLDRTMRARSVRLMGAALIVGPAAPAAPAPDSFVARDTPANLQAAFTKETNEKERYTQYARKAELEGYKDVARLFRACAQAEQVHARRHVQAIAYTLTGDPARAVMEPMQIGSTVENLRAALANEVFESTVFYPAILARARSDNQPMAVRSINLSLAAEREHVGLLEAALAGLVQHAGPAAFYVCPYCGKTVVSRDFKKCPNCFKSAAKFIKIT